MSAAEEWSAVAPYTLDWDGHCVGDGHQALLEEAGIASRMKVVGAGYIVDYLRSTAAQERTPVATMSAGESLDLQACHPGTVVAYRREHLSALAGVALPPLPSHCTPAVRPTRLAPGEADTVGGIRLGAFQGQIRYRQQVVYGTVVAGRDGQHHLLYAENGIIQGISGTAAAMEPHVLFREHTPASPGTVTHCLSSGGRREQLSRVLALEVRYEAPQQERRRWRLPGIFSR